MVKLSAFEQSIHVIFILTYPSGVCGDSNANGGIRTTRVATDPGTHQDFQPTKCSNMSL